MDEHFILVKNNLSKKHYIFNINIIMFGKEMKYICMDTCQFSVFDFLNIFKVGNMYDFKKHFQ